MLNLTEGAQDLVNITCYYKFIQRNYSIKFNERLVLTFRKAYLAHLFLNQPLHHSFYYKKTEVRRRVPVHYAAPLKPAQQPSTSSQLYLHHKYNPSTLSTLLLLNQQLPLIN